MSCRLLIVDEDVSKNNMLKELLEKDYVVEQCFNSSEALTVFGESQYHGVLIDGALSKVLCDELVEAIHQQSDVMILVLLLREEIESSLFMLKNGVRDFIGIPLSAQDVLVKVQLNLHPFELSNDKEIRVDDFVMNLVSHSFSVSNQEVQLTQKEFELLRLFLSYPKQIFTKQFLYRRIWNDPFVGDDNTLAVHISRLRSKLIEASGVEVIETIRGVGFRFLV